MPLRLHRRPHDSERAERSATGGTILMDLQEKIASFVEGQAEESGVGEGKVEEGKGEVGGAGAGLVAVT